MKQIIILITTLIFSYTFSYAIEFTDQDIGDRIPIKEPILGYNSTSGGYLDPFSDDQILFKITSENYLDYEKYLTPGQVKMFRDYGSTFFMNIYPSRRSCAVPDKVIELSKNGNAKLTDGGEGIEGTVGSIPFPNAIEPLHHVWNHILRYRGVDIEGGSPYYVVSYDGEKFNGAGKAIAKNYWNPFVSNNKGLQGKIMTKVTHPPRLADAGVLVIESLNALATPRRAWVYSPANRRVRRAPDIAYDNYSGFSQGLTTIDSFDGFNGAKDRYNWNDGGTKLKFMPYNSYRFYNTNHEEALTALHVNQEYLRYELVKVNIVNADLKDGMRHILPHRVMYFDNDSHNFIAEDIYDGEKNIMRYRELPIMNFYDEPMCNAIHAASYDFATKRYLLNNVRSIDVPKIKWRLDKPHKESMFTPEGFKRWAK
tara:strand:+ start:1476 stop:2750 length:1275 start_codon:yes stop_codon:yes gene_type:complete